MGLDIEVDNLHREFDTDDGLITAIERFDFSIDPGTVVTMVGPTGCGKSTILNIILGVLSPSEGDVLVDGRRPYSDDDFHSFRGEISAVFQDDRLLPWRTASQNAKLGLEALDVPKDEQDRLIDEWFPKLGLEGYQDAYPDELSGGMRQRVGLIRGYVVDPEVLLLDEAFGHLDEVTATKLREDFLSLIETEDDRKTVFFITHDIEEAIVVGDRVLVSRSPGHIIDDIEVPPEVNEDPEFRYDLKERIIDGLR
jgi:NitT/TauT family transport system ATP-binding protein